MLSHIGRACFLTAFIVVASTSLSHAITVRIDCGSLVENKVVTRNNLFETTATTFTAVPAAFVDITIPAATTRCVKLRFNAGVTCKGGSGSEVCYVRGLVNGAVMNPAGGSRQGMTGRAFGPTGVSFTWVNRLGAGTHRLTIEVRTDPSTATTVGVDDWTMDVEVLN
jgi:hypothetical protein